MSAVRSYRFTTDNCEAQRHDLEDTTTSPMKIIILLNLINKRRRDVWLGVHLVMRYRMMGGCNTGINSGNKVVIGTK